MAVNEDETGASQTPSRVLSLLSRAAFVLDFHLKLISGSCRDPTILYSACEQYFGKTTLLKKSNENHLNHSDMPHN